MGLLAEAVRSYGGWQGPFGLGDKALAALFGGRQVDAGVVVNDSTALTYSALWCGITLISNTLGAVPLHYLKITGADARERDRDHPLDRLVSADASGETSAFQFRRAMQMNALLDGNGYAEITRMRDTRLPAALYVLDSSRVTPFRDVATRRLGYRVANDDGTTVTLDAANMLHIAGPSRDGLMGLSVVALAKQAIGLGLAAEKFGARFFGSGARMGGILTAPGRLSTLARQNLRTDVEGAHSGVDRSHRMLILEEGLKYEATSVPPEEAQFTATRIHQIVEVARFLNMPPTLLAAAHDGLTYRNAAEEAQRFVDHCLLPWATCWESELNRKLIPALERSRAYFAHNFNGLVRGDLPTRYAAFKIGVDGGWLSANDVRQFEDMNPIVGGDVYGRPVATAPANSAGPGRGDHLSLLAGRRLVEDTVRRSLTREADRARRATTLATLQTWADTFYTAGEAAVVASHLEPVLSTIATVNDPATLAREIAADMHVESLRDLGALARTAPVDVQAAVRDLTHTWVQSRPRAIADAVITRIMS
jgi:HK97 family phage portal protein